MNEALLEPENKQTTINYREIMEKQLGRKLLSSELVHHIDGNMHNNDPTNLALMTTHSEHRAQNHPTKEIYRKRIDKLLTRLEHSRYDELYEALSSFFTKRQIEIIFRRLLKLPISKTEQQYFYRTIKKKLRALANPLLHKIGGWMWETTAYW